MRIEKARMKKWKERERDLPRDCLEITFCEQQRAIDFCTGTGRMPAIEAAEQMLVAYNMIVKGSWKSVVHPILAAYSNRTYS